MPRQCSTDREYKYTRSFGAQVQPVHARSLKFARVAAGSGAPAAGGKDGFDGYFAAVPVDFQALTTFHRKEGGNLSIEL